MTKYYDAVDEAFVLDVLRRGDLGPADFETSYTRRFQEAFAARVGVAHAVLRNTALNGLAQAVMLSGAKEGDEVLCDPVVQFGAIAALSAGRSPKFVDVDGDTYLMDLDALELEITPRTKALIVTHLWGACPDMDRLAEVCRARGIFLIEDCAHALGTTWNGRHAGSFGNVGVFSFHHRKQLSTGQGCMMTTNDDVLAHSLTNEWPSGEAPAYLTLNYRSTELNAAVGLAQLGRYDQYLRDYNAKVQIMNDAISECTLLRRRRLEPGVRQAGYWWACHWVADIAALERFKHEIELRRLDVEFGFTKVAAPEHDLLREAARKFATVHGSTASTQNLLDRVVTMDIMPLTIDETHGRASLLREALVAVS